ncbi:hypothetical protein SFC88_13750 [Nocardioides sp. HM23]|uniref:hypothetical protein n=1 Tax=Nocardioides bizhenqiangii TaxID=3095076 RepID=UPI002ACAECCD|nr:hypothetical protein [Nocardioides sp. HM23]MDZ5621906.1 hypothetical protein [Nocardioides sp. HM23]
MWTIFFIGLGVFLVGSLIYLEFRPQRRGLRDRWADPTANRFNHQAHSNRLGNSGSRR